MGVAYFITFRLADSIGANVVITPCWEGLGSCAAAENARRCPHTIVPINNSTRGRKISLCIKRLSFKRESRAQPHPALFARTRFVFRIQRRRSFISKTTQAIPCNSSEKPTEGGTRCPQRVGRADAALPPNFRSSAMRWKRHLAPSASGIVLAEADRRWNVLSSTRWQNKYGFAA
jgi:hypothetical protein